PIRRQLGTLLLLFRPLHQMRPFILPHLHLIKLLLSYPHLPPLGKLPLGLVGKLGLEMF
ncbi:hypothetical protein JYU34_007255, partial [Plutella xylostella]